jgi:hypothetical protein
MTCGISASNLIGGNHSRRRGSPGRARNCRTKSHRRRGGRKKRRNQRGGKCGACKAQTGGGAIASAIVPAFILAALYKLTKKNKHTKTRRGPTRKRRR